MTEEQLLGLEIRRPDEKAYEKAKKRFDALAKPIDGFGVFEDMICRIAAVQQTDAIDISKKGLVVMCADNGVVEEGVSQCGRDVTSEVARLLAAKKSTVCRMTRDQQVDITIVDVGIDSDPIEGVLDRKVAKGTGNITKEPAMTRVQCLEAISAGIEVAGEMLKKGIKMIATGEMGIGNTTTSAALLCALCGKDPEDIVSYGAGLTEEGFARKKAAVKKALRLHAPDNKITPVKEHALSMLEKLGGFDIAGLSGVFIGGALYGITIVIDGLISAVSALAAEYICPGTSGYMLASHLGKESGCAICLERLGLKAPICAELAIGEGTGAVMLFPLIDMVYSVYNNGTNFEDTVIEQYKRYKK